MISIVYGAIAGLDVGSQYIRLRELGSKQFNVSITMPVCIFGEEQDDLLVKPYTNQYDSFLDCPIRDFKQYMGPRLEEVTSDHLQMHLNNHQLHIQMNDTSYTPEALYAKLITKMVTTETPAVVTYPMYFSKSQQLALKDMLSKTPIRVVDMISDAKAVAIAYTRYIKKEGLILVVDLGTVCQVSIVSLEDMEVKAYQYDKSLNANMITNAIYEEFKKQLSTTRLPVVDRRTVLQDKEVLDALWEYADRYRLQHVPGHDFDSAFKVPGYGFTIKAFHELRMDPIYESFSKSLSVLTQAAGREAASVGRVENRIYVGGLANDLVLLRTIQGYGYSDSKFSDIDPNNAVAYGASVYAQSLRLNENDEL